jgi:hypothetical protein
LLLFFAINALATAITTSTSLAMSPIGGMLTCGHTGSATVRCTSGSQSNYAMAQATAADGSVYATVSGSAFGLATMASARASAYLSQDFLFTQGSGSGLLLYVITLSGSNGGDVLFNGGLYQMLPNGRPARYGFTRSFTYGQPVTISLALDVCGSWVGYNGESGSISALAQLDSVQVLGGSSQRVATATESIPEPSTAVLWFGAFLLIAAGGMHRKRKQR